MSLEWSLFSLHYRLFLFFFSMALNHPPLKSAVDADAISSEHSGLQSQQRACALEYRAANAEGCVQDIKMDKWDSEHTKEDSLAGSVVRLKSQNV